MAEPTLAGSTIITVGGSGTWTGNYDVGSGTDRSLVATIGIYDTSFTDPITVSTITYNSTSLGTAKEIAEHQFSAGNNTVKVWSFTLDNPTSGENEFSFALSEAVTLCFLTLSHYTGANNGVGTNTAETGGNISDHEYDITTTDADGVVIQAGMTNATRTITPGTGTTVQEEDLTGTTDSYHWMATESASGSTDTVGVTLASAARSASCMIELKAAAAAGGDPEGPLVGGKLVNGGILQGRLIR